MTAPYDLLASPVFLVVAALCAGRLTHLVTADSITEDFRLWASRYDWSRELIHCPFCIGFWLSLATATALPLLWHIPLFRVTAVALAINYAFAILETATSKD